MVQINNRSRALIKIETNEGLHGWGEAYSIGPDLAAEPIANYIFELIKGEDPRRIEYLMLKLHQQFRFPIGGVGLAVISAVDHALWDISGKAAGLPTYMLLGGSVRDRVEVYLHLGGKSGKEAADHAGRLNENWGVTVFKTSPYRIDMLANRWGMVCATAAIFFSDPRQHTPSNWEFAFDAHAKVFEPIRALQLANALADYDPYFYEEPIRPEHIPAWSQLKSQIQVPLATGECLYTRFEFLDLITQKGADIIQPDVCACGGLLEMKKIAAIGEAHYVSIAPHNPMGPLATAVHLHFAVSTPNFKLLEYNPPDAYPWVDEPYLPKDGYLEMRDRPGLGIDIIEEAIPEKSYQHWQRDSLTKPDGSTGYI